MKTVNLFDICSPKQWKTISGTQIMKEGNYPVYGANGIIGFFNQYNHEQETLLITCRGATCGTLNISLPKSYINGNAMALDNLSENVDLKFLYYSLLVRGFSDVISGSAQPQITREGLQKVKIPLPPLTVQKEIAEKLDKADALRKKDQELLKQYDELAQAIFIDMFGDPVQNEKGWEITKLDKVCEKILGGGTPSKSKPEYYEGEIPWVTPKDMKFDMINNSIDHINLDAVENSSAKLIPPHSLLMVIRSGILKHTLPLGINTIQVTINQDMKAFIPDESKTNVYFLKGFFKAIEPFLLKKVRAVTADNIEFSQIKELDFPIILPKLQNQFAEKIQNIEAQKEILKKQAQLSEELFQALLQESFSF